MKNILVNASNLHVGGGVQVASSFLYEIAGNRLTKAYVSVIVSTEVNDSLRSLGVQPSDFCNYTVFNTNGFRGCFRLYRKIKNFDTVFTVFGPLYIIRKSFFNIVGFARPHIIYPNDVCVRWRHILRRFSFYVKNGVQGFFVKRSDLIIVELDHVKDRLVELLQLSPERIQVVRNCVSSIYSNEALWQPTFTSSTGSAVRLGFVGRNYPHKNTDIFPKIVSILQDEFNLSARFFVTFSQDEWSACDPTFKACCQNVGPLLPAQCPRFYGAMDAVVFPSLLECFSATPLEAMVMRKPLFVSDRPFNRDICGEYGHFFDPNSPYSAAKAIADVFSQGGVAEADLDRARRHALEFSSPQQRAQRYLELCGVDFVT